MITSVRSAKTRLSELLQRAAAGEEIVIAAAGRPRARLVALGETPSRPFRVNRAVLRGRPKKGTRAERLVRAERDGRD
jgi:prevent-host-death family protein